MTPMHTVHGKHLKTRLPPLTPLHTFVVTANFLSFTAAAKYLCLTQGSVSRQISNLETALGFLLFERHSKGLHLSDKGAALLPGMQQAFELIRDNIERVTDEVSALKIHAPTCIMRWLMPKLASFRRQYPELPIEITASVSHNTDLIDTPFDAAITYGQSQGENLQDLLLFSEQLTPICQPAVYLEKFDPQLTIGDNLQNFSWLHATENRSDWQLWLSAAGGEQWQPLEHQHFPTLDMTMTAAAQGLGMAMGDKTLIVEDLQQGRLQAPFALSISTGAHYLFSYPKSSPLHAELNTLANWLKLDD